MMYRLLAVAVLAPALVLAHTTPSAARMNSAAAAATAGIIGLAVGAAIANNSNRSTYVYGAPPPPTYVPPAPFSPAANVVCYPGQRACYYNGGAYAADWSWRVYGRN